MEAGVPSTGRSSDVRTIEALVAAGLSPLVVTWPAQVREYVLAAPGARIVPCKVRGIALTRQWILETVQDPYIVMVDDDLSFHTRRTDDPTKFVPSTSKDIAKLFKTFDNHLQNYAHV